MVQDLFHGAMRRAGRAVIVLAATGGFAFPASATSWYFDGLNGGESNTGTASSPFLYFWQAQHAAQPGDTIVVVNSMTYTYIGFTTGGTAAAPVTLSGNDPAHPTVVIGGGIHSAISINTNYTVVKNFNTSATGSYAGISVNPHVHHVTIANNVVHDSGGNGINLNQNDYVTITNNVVYGNAHNTTQAFGSGISIKGSVDVDSNTGVKMVVNGNTVYSNTNIPNCTTSSCFASAHDSDGSGIILDTNNGEGVNPGPYKGAFLISNNLVYRNGGRGIYSYKSDNIKIVGNTCYFNNQDPYESSWHPGEIMATKSGNVKIYNNIVYSDGRNGKTTGASPNSHMTLSFENDTDGVGPMVAQHNVAYNPQNNSALLYYVQNNTNPVTVSANVFGDPKLENPGVDFRFTPHSPAFDTAYAPMSTATDILGVSRLPLPGIGAYQRPGP